MKVKIKTRFDHFPHFLVVVFTIILLLGISGCSTRKPAILSAQVKVSPAAVTAPQMMSALRQAREAITRAEGKGKEVRKWPGWKYVGAMRKMVEDVEALRKTGNYAAAYKLARSSKFSLLKNKVVTDVLNAMPFMIIGPFGKPGWEGKRTYRKNKYQKMKAVYQLTIPEFELLSKPWLGEIKGNDYNNLNKEFRPALQKSANFQKNWQKTLKTDILLLDEIAPPYPDWMIIYAYTEVYCPEPRDASIEVNTEFGSPPSTWVSGRRVTSGGTVTGSAIYNLNPYSGKIHCGLRKGWNGILMKFIHRKGAKFKLDILRRKRKNNKNVYEPMDDLEYRLPGLNALKNN